MDLIPTSSTTKRSRAKAPDSAKVTRKPTLTTKATRSRTKAATEIELLSTPALVSVTSDQLRAIIATAAYYRAAARQFAPGHEMEDWLSAEKQVLAEMT